MVIQNNLTHASKIKTLIMDLDGTITRWKSVESFLAKSLNILGIPYDNDSLLGLYEAMKARELHAILTGETAEEIYSMFLEMYIPKLQEYGHNGNDLKEVMFELEAQETYINEDVKKEIEILAKYYSLYVYTNWFRKQALKKLDKYDLTKYFQAIYSSDDIDLKYSKIGFVKLIINLNLDKNTIVHIGDSESDIMASSCAGISSIYINYEASSKDDINPNLMNKATATVTEFQDIRRILKRKE